MKLQDARKRFRETLFAHLRVGALLALFSLKTLASQGHPFSFVTHDGIFDVSSLLNAAPYHIGAAHPRRATAARVLRAHVVWGPPKHTGAHSSAGKRHSNADELLLKYARSRNSTDWKWIACALFGNKTALQGFGNLSRRGKFRDGS